MFNNKESRVLYRIIEEYAIISIKQTLSENYYAKNSGTIMEGDGRP